MTKTIKDNQGKTHNVQEIGIDKDTGKPIEAVDLNGAEWITETKIRLSNGKIVSIDPNENSFELYNPNNFTVVIENKHWNPIEHHWKSVELKPDSFVFIPHTYITVWIERIGNKSGLGEDINLIQNFGSDMFKNNKKPSRPDVKKAQVFQS